jgi:hypothetical protein
MSLKTRTKYLNQTSSSWGGGEGVCVSLPNTPLPFFDSFSLKNTVLRIRILGMRMFLVLLDPDPDPLVRGTDPPLYPVPDPSIIKQK